MKDKSHYMKEFISHFWRIAPCNYEYSSYNVNEKTTLSSTIAMSTLTNGLA